MTSPSEDLWLVRTLALRTDLRRALERDEPVETVLERCAYALVEHLALVAAVVWLRGDASDDLVPAAAAGSLGPAAAGTPAVPGTHIVGTVDTMVAWQTSTPASFPELSLGGRIDLRTVSALAAYPLLGRTRATGALCLYLREPLPQHVSTLLTFVADLIAVTVASRRLVSARDTLQEELRQSQKMEALGKLAGGIAHDFNNILTVMSGYVTLTMERLGGDHEVYQQMSEVYAGVHRATALVNQLLRFSRRRDHQPRHVDLNGAIKNLRSMLTRLIPEDIQLSTYLCAEPCVVNIDLVQLEQILVNLAVNARDAMPRGGRLILKTSRVPTADGDPRSSAGSHVELQVTDTGTGMSAHVQEHAFEPFFTTKDAGRGSGIGLSTVRGIVEQAGGRIVLASGPECGTTFTILLPAVDDPAAEVAYAPTLGVRPPGGHEVILVAEDERPVRRLAANILKSAGYIVYEANDGDEAAAMARSISGLDLVLSDVVMPGLRGPELARLVGGLSPAPRVLLMSGYAADAAIVAQVAAGSFAFIEKPFTPYALLACVRQLLDLERQQTTAAGAPPPRRD